MFHHQGTGLVLEGAMGVRHDFVAREGGEGGKE